MSINNDTNAERGAPLVRSNVNSVEDSIEGRHSDQFDSETETETETELDTDTPFYKTISLPLAELIRPHDLELYTGQDHLVNKENGSIKNFIQLGFLPSMILYGPPGVGKTTIASILARETNYEFVELSATDSTVADLKKLQMEISVENDRRRANNEDYLHIVVFIDEIHRFTKTQQDFLLPYIESGHFVFIGATTVNPKSRIRRAILSRCQMFELRSLSEGEITKVLQRAILFENIRRRCVYDAKFLKFDSRSVEYIVKESSGDSRSAINMIELVSGNFLDGKDLKYVKGDHEPFHVSIQDIRRILSQRRDIGDRKLRDSRNLNLLLKLFDSMRNVFKRREIEDIQRNASTATDNDEDRFDETEADESITDMYTQMDYIPSRVNIYKDENRVVANENDNVPQGKDSSIEESVSLPSLKKVSVGRFDFTSLLDKFTVDELDTRIQNSDDSDIEQLGPYSDIDDELEINEPVLEEDQYVYLSKYYLNALIERGETSLFLIKQLILFTCLYPDNKVVNLNEAVAMIKTIKNSSADPKKVLSNFIERSVRARKRKIHSEFSDPIKRLKVVKEAVRRTMKESEPDYNLPILYDEDLVRRLLDDCKDEEEKKEVEIEVVEGDETNFLIEPYDATKHIDLFNI